MTRSRFAILDPLAGISGDMLLGALVAAGAPRDWLEGLPARLGFPDVTIRIEPVVRCGVSATKVTVALPGGRVEAPGDLEAGHHHHHGGHDHPHRHLSELIALVERAPLSEWTRGRARAAFLLLGEAEARVHGGRPEDVALHEVGAVDAVVDIIGAVEGFEQLGIETIYHRPLALGSGWVRAAHGALPVPAPATALLVEGLEIASGGPVVGEATTPTGAVLLRVLSRGAPPPRWTLRSSHWGAGTRDPAHYPNALRLLLAEAAGEEEPVVVMATDVDDLSPEYVEPVRNALVEAGALDVQVWATQMKKGRTGFRLELLCREHQVDPVTEALFRHSTTIGIRYWRSERVTLPRREVTVLVDGIPVRVKVVDAPGGRRVKPEYDDLSVLASRTGRPMQELAAEARRLAQDLAES